MSIHTHAARGTDCSLSLSRSVHQDLYSDLASGVILINLLEIVSKEPIGRKFKAEPKMRIHKLENLKAAFEYG